MRAFGLESGDVRVRLSDRRLLGSILEALDLGGDRERLAHQALDKLGRREYGAARQALLDAGARSTRRRESGVFGLDEGVGAGRERFTDTRARRGCVRSSMR